MGRFKVGMTACLLLAVTGCTTPPPQPAPPTDQAPGIALTESEALAVAADYDNRNNAAIASTVKANDATAWSAADTGPMLAVDRFLTAVAWNGGARFTSLRVTLTPRATWANRFTSYPIWAMIRVRVQNEPPVAGSADEGLVVLRRVGPTAPWLTEMIVDLSGVPNAPDDGAGLTTPADLDAALTTMNETVDFLERGTRPDFYVTPRLDVLRSQFSVMQPDGSTSSAVCRPYFGKDQPRDSLRVVRSTSGVLSVMSLLCSQTTTAKPGGMVTRPAGYAKALGVPDAPAVTLTQPWAVTVAVSRPTKGGAIAVGATSYPVRSG